MEILPNSLSSTGQPVIAHCIMFLISESIVSVITKILILNYFWKIFQPFGAAVAITSYLPFCVNALSE